MGLISRKLCRFLFMFSTGFTLIVSSNIDEVLLINPPANVFVFANVNANHTD